jgi:hypothetical protein
VKLERKKEQQKKQDELEKLKRHGKRNAAALGSPSAVPASTSPARPLEEDTEPGFTVLEADHVPLGDIDAGTVMEPRD